MSWESYGDEKKFNHMLDRHFKKFLLIFGGVLRGGFRGFGCPKRHPDALLAKTMILGIDLNGHLLQGHEVLQSIGNNM